MSTWLGDRLTRSRLRAWHFAAAVLAVWVFMYIQYPLGGDQGILLWVGDVIRGGGLPYRDAFDIRGPAFDYLHALIVVVFGHNEWGIRLFDLLMLALGCWLVWRIALPMAGPVAARASALLFLLWYAALDYWSSAQSDGWTAVLLAAVVALLAIGQRLTLWRAAFAGALIACCTLNKPTYAVFLLLPAVRVLAERARGMRWVLAMLATAGVGFAVPILVCVGWFAARGALDDLIEVHILWTLSVYSGLAQPWLTRVQTAIGWLLTSKFAVALGVGAGGLAFLAHTRRADAVLIAVWLGLGLLNVVAQGKYWQYQWLVIYPPVAVLCGIGVHGLTRLRAARQGALTLDPADRDTALATRTIPAAVMGVLFVAALFSPALEIYRWVKAEVGLTDAQEYDDMQYGPYGRGPESYVAIARYIASRTTERDEVLVWGTVHGINFLSGRRSPTRFAYLRALTDVRDSRFRPKYLREFLDDVRTKPPTYIVALDEKWCGVTVRSGLTATDHIAFPMRCLSELPEFQRFVGERYAIERSFGTNIVLRLRTMAA